MSYKFHWYKVPFVPELSDDKSEGSFVKQWWNSPMIPLKKLQLLTKYCIMGAHDARGRVKTAGKRSSKKKCVK